MSGACVRMLAEYLSSHIHACMSLLLAKVV